MTEQPHWADVSGCQDISHCRSIVRSPELDKIFAS